VDALAQVEGTGERWFEPELHRLRGELLVSIPDGDRAQAEACFRHAIATARQCHMRLWELRAATSLARLLAEPREALALLAPVYDWFTEGFDTADLKDAKALLDELS
jgi:predicted ATPase